MAAGSTRALICDTGALIDYLVESAPDLRLGLVDASLVTLAEDLGLRRLATRDVRHFRAVRLRDGSSFELVVEPTAPDRS